MPSNKSDQEKPRTDLVLGGFAKALLAVSEVGTFGARKYTDNGWRGMPNAKERINSAMLRHWLTERTTDGETMYDLESGLLHAAHAAWNALAYLELLLEDLSSHSPKHFVPTNAEVTPGDIIYTKE